MNVNPANNWQKLQKMPFVLARPIYYFDHPSCFCAPLLCTDNIRGALDGWVGDRRRMLPSTSVLLEQRIY